MKALTIWQPWASLIIAGAKPYEFRGWKPPASTVGQRIAIHAGARPVKLREVNDLLESFTGSGSVPCLHASIAMPILERVFRDPKLLPLSHVLGSAILGEPKAGDECAREFGYAGNDSDREGTFNWGWPLTDIEPCEPPVPATGMQGLWEWRA